MKVARLHSVGDVRLHDEPAPSPKPGETLARITAVGLCGSDLHWFSEAGIGDARLARPLVLGHEFAGVTEAGQRVAVDPAVPCGECEFCQEGNPNLCLTLNFAGHGQTDGALREWLAWPTRCLFPIPDSLSDVEGAMLEPLGVAIHAVDLGKVRAGMRVGVFGCGPIGLLVLQVARRAGATDMFVTEPLTHRLEAAQQLGAKEWKPGQEVDVAFECAGENEAVDDAIAAVRPGGRIVLVGIPGNDRTSFSASVARRKGLTLKLSRRMKHTYPRAIRLVESEQVDVQSLVTHRFPLGKIAEAFAVAQRREGLKVIIEPA
ncbi:MAG TPA: alcohol dehydrogenase catalytic domain-containing protein [Anaerolineales bacterium]|nr:alcohol dehydrogenase catalytic domain-containing protein [Anaerolineales bacterium]